MKILILSLFMCFSLFAQGKLEILFDDDWTPAKLNPFMEIKPSAGVTKNANNKITAWASTTYNFAQSDTALSPNWLSTEIDFDSTDRMDLADANAGSFDFGTNDFSVDFWVKTNQVSAGVRLLSKYLTVNPRWIISFNNGVVAFLLRDAVTSTITTTATIKDNLWHHIAVILDRNVGAYIYIDGSQSIKEETTEWTDKVSLNVDNVAALSLGYSGSAEFYQGQIFSIRAYLSALTPAQVLQLYNYGRK